MVCILMIYIFDSSQVAETLRVEGNLIFLSMWYRVVLCYPFTRRLFRRQIWNRSFAIFFCHHRSLTVRILQSRWLIQLRHIDEWSGWHVVRVCQSYTQFDMFAIEWKRELFILFWIIAMFSYASDPPHWVWWNLLCELKVQQTQWKNEKRSRIWQKAHQHHQVNENNNLLSDSVEIQCRWKTTSNVSSWKNIVFIPRKKIMNKTFCLFRFFDFLW